MTWRSDLANARSASSVHNKSILIGATFSTNPADRARLISLASSGLSAFSIEQIPLSSDRAGPSGHASFVHFLVAPHRVHAPERVVNRRPFNAERALLGRVQAHIFRRWVE